MRKGSTEPAAEWEKERLTVSNGLKLAREASSEGSTFNVTRRVYQRDSLNKDADYYVTKKTFKNESTKFVRSCGFKDCLLNSLYIVKWLPKYKIKEYFVGDIIAGATTAVMHIPQGMAYALLAEVPPIVGLYMAFFPIIIYAMLGTSPHISLGTFAVACLMAGKVVTQYATHIEAFNATTLEVSRKTLGEEDDVVPANIYTPLEILSVLCFTVGIIQILMWVFRLGAAAALLSEPLVSGFTTAASFHVLASQLKDLFGVALPKYAGNYKVVITVVQVINAMSNINVAATVMSLITCLVIALNNELLKPWVSKRSRVPVPIELIAIVGGTLTSRYVNLQEKFNIKLVGNIPTGLPAPELPQFEVIPLILVDAITITIVTYTISMSMALIFAAKEKYEIDGNQELLALGASNVFSSFFTCAPCCASLSRSYIQYQAGAKTQVTGLVNSGLILMVLLWIGPFFEDLPRSVLASIIVVSLKGMFMQVTELAKFWRLSKLDALVWIITFVTTLFVNIDIGLGVGLVASVGALFVRSQKPYTCLLGRVLNTDIYLDIKRYRAAEELAGIKIFHYCGGLNFATKNLFRQTFYRKIGYMTQANVQVLPDDDQSTKSESYVWDPKIARKLQCVVIDATALSYVDAPGIKTIVACHKELDTHGITVLLAGANAPTLEMIDRYNSLEPDGLHMDTFPTVHDAVVYYKVMETKKHAHKLTENHNEPAGITIDT